MPAVPVDLTLSARWILPMTSRDEVLENHTVVVRDGRILDLLPSGLAADRYEATVHTDRSQHVLLPGLVNAYAQIAPALGRSARPERLHEGAQLCIADMLRSGTTCFCGTGYFPDESARTALETGLRALIGIPIGETAGPWAAGGEYLTRALEFRDEYRGHPSIATAFAPTAPAAIGDETFLKIATMVDEVDAGLIMPLHASRREVEDSIAKHGLRPLERMHRLGLLTPALTAVHMAHIDTHDRELAQRGGIALTLCPQADAREANPPPVNAWAGAGLRLGVGSGTAPGTGFDLWSELKLLALLSLSSSQEPRTLSAWDALAAATRGAAAALGLDQEIGTLERNKWADICCVDLESPAMQWLRDEPAQDLPRQLVFNGGRDTVSDVWVAGRQLLDGGTFTRLDWPALNARIGNRKA
jgi:5-methylthioadenosine/S-adenosylhomocysteine deaminase